MVLLVQNLLGGKKLSNPFLAILGLKEKKIKPTDMKLGRGGGKAI